jgi:ubiquinone/menaquinone biosynthesis C-methylase UbiE
MRHQLVALARTPRGDRLVSGNTERRAALQAERAAALAAQLDALLQLGGDERALDVGAGTGAFAFAIAPRVREVVAVEIDQELAARARADAPANVEVVVADGAQLPFERASFDLAGTLRALHHAHRPELLVAELARVTRPGGTILVADQLAPADPLAALDLTRFERARDPSTTRILADADMRGLFDSNSLTLKRQLVVHEPRDLDAYLDLAGCDGDEREYARNLAPSGYEAVVAWYILAR